MSKFLSPLLSILVLGLSPVAQAQQAPFKALLGTEPLQSTMPQVAGRTLRVAPTISTPVASRSTSSDPCNLVPNGGFEDQKVSMLSGSLGNVYRPGGLDELSNWQSTITTTADYYATNSLGTNTHPNTSLFGSFMPYEGRGSLGLLALQPLPVNQGGPFYAEYATVDLGSTNTLQAGSDYYASMRVYSAGNGQYASYVGMNLSAASPINYTPTSSYTRLSSNAGDQLIVSSGPVSAQQWTPVAQVITPGTALRYLTVGNFGPATATVSNVRPNAPYPYAYVYVDDVQLYKIPTAGANKSCPAPTGVDLGETCSIPGATYAWRSSASGSTVLGTSPMYHVTSTVTATYTLTVTLPNVANPYSSSATVTACPPPPCPTLADYSVTQLSGQYSCLTNRCHYDFAISGPSSDYHWSLNDTYYDMVSIRGRYVDQPTIAVGRDTPSPFVPLPTGHGPGTMTIYCVFRDPSGLCDDVAVPVVIWYDGIYGEIHRSGTTGNSSAPTGAYPNPASERLTLPVSATEAELLNSAGTVVLRASSAQRVLDVHELPAGTYYLRTLQEGKATTQRVQVTH
jgi:hypothetical protein